MTLRFSLKKLMGFVFIFLLLVYASPVHAELQHTPASQQRFEDVSYWVKVFEDPERDAWQKPGEVVKALDLKRGDVVADLGAGTGYFTRRLAVAVGNEGKAIGLEVEPKMVEHMKKDADKLKLPNYLSKLIPYDDALLEPQSVDMVFICDTYHHIENRVEYLKKLSKGIKKGGRVVVVDFHKKQLPVGPPPEHKLSEEIVLKEFHDAGYRVVRTHCILPYQYFIEFGM
ncbi:MAG: class I SAM-dependent methyltransferase [Nitrospiraceae bacterium]|nr:MAG: class I SAM-dependent methyltransferase [Nitrospiraceae bacterium]